MKVYLLHFFTPLAHAKHYIGKATHVHQRLGYHRQGNGARILQVCNERGINYDVVREWKLPNDKASAFERHLKNGRKEATRLCPICNPDRWYKNEVEYNYLPKIKEAKMKQ